MSKFTFKYELDDSKVKHTFDAEHIDDVIMFFQEFLHGCGFYFDGDVKIVKPEIFVHTPYEDLFYDYDEHFIYGNQESAK
jgi:hypothetical protein